MESIDSIFSWTTPPELDALYQLAINAPEGAAVVEIGSYLGASTCYLCAGLRPKRGHLYCVDTWQNETMPEGPRDTFSEFMQNVDRWADMITPIRKKTSDVTDQDLPSSIDLVFIDGDHNYEVAKIDFELVAGRLSPEGIIAFHDVGAKDHPGVGRVVGEAIASGWRPAGVVETLMWLRPPILWREPVLFGES